MAAFQVNNGSTWMNYAPREDSLLKMAFSAGQTLCKFSLNGATYECDFKRMVQRNLVSGKEREIRLQGGKPSKDGASGNNAASSEDNNQKEAVEDVEGNDVITAVVVDEGGKRKGWTTRKKALVGAGAGAMGAAGLGGALYGAYQAGRNSARGDAAPSEHAAGVPSGPDYPICEPYHPGYGPSPDYPICEPYYPGYGPSPDYDSMPVPPHAGEDPDDMAEADFEDDDGVWEPACGDDASYWGGSDCDDFDFDGFDDGADFDADSGEAMADIIACMF